jgi:asparagine synthase (glutamine-hydrolysing)
VAAARHRAYDGREMCGICGAAGRDLAGPPIEARELQAMTDVVRHRGPDDDGHLLAPGVALGMRRLSIIDLPGSSQPISNEDGTVSTVFNGEIYNYRELREGLHARGHSFGTEGDTETIVHLYEEHGERFPEHLRGMFAIAVWDAPRRRLVLARDRMGVKPLYVADGPFGLAFASEVKSLIAGGLVEPALDPVGAELFMAFGYVPGPATLFRGVRKLMPARTLVWEDGALRGEREYWRSADHAPDRAGATWEDDRRELLDLLRRATEARMISDVPLGVLLSGGIDSSLVTALMADASTLPVKTFSIGFAEDGAANELDDARLVAERLGTEHHELVTSAVDHPDLLDEALWHLEEPIADLTPLGFLLVSRLARENVTVALSGQGADEILGGYRKHQIAAGASWIPGPARAAVAAAGRLAPAGSTLARGLAAAAIGDPVERLLAMSRVVQPHERLETFSPAFLHPEAEVLIREAVAQHLDGRERSALGETLYLDTRIGLVDNQLLYPDKASMAASLEVRVPFMDHDVVAFCEALPDARRVSRLRRKALLKDASRGLVPDSIVDKKKRGFFRGGLGTWMRVHREELLRETLLDERARTRGQFRPEVAADLVAGAGEGGIKHSQRLLCMLLLERWQRLFVDPDGRARRGELRPAEQPQRVA